jgi:hypothetical protein
MMKKLYRLFFVLFFLLFGDIGFPQAVQPTSEVLPSRAITNSRFNVVATVMDDDTWCRVEWPGRSYYLELLHNDREKEIDYYQIDRFSNFDPNGSPLLGDTTFLDTTSVSEYNDYDWAGLPQGWFAYGVKSHYTSGEWSDYNISNVVGHLNSFTVVISVILCDTTWWEYTVLTVNGVVYPIDMEGGSGSVTIEFFSPIICEITIYAPGNDYSIENIYIHHDVDINIPLSCIHFLPRNLFVDPVSLHATWDPPQVVGLDQDFEDNTFPPAGWQALSEGNGWFRTSDGSGAGWSIPGWYSHYACTNDLLPGNGNNGSMDYLITPPVDLKYRYNNFLTFYSYFDGNNGQEAFVEYSFDCSSWDTLYQLEPSTSWEYIELDLNAFSGPESDRIWFAFHADDNGQNASGWAIDSVRVFSPEPPYTLDGYWVFLYDSLIAITDTTSINLPVLSYGQEYTLCVKSHYPSGLSEAECTTFTSYYLYPPSCFYHADTGIMTLVMCPPQDSTGAIPEGFIGFNLYRNGDFVDFLEFQPIYPIYEDEGLEPGFYHYELTAVYDLTPYGYPGETGESMPLETEYFISYGYPLPFLENWNLGNFYDNNWLTDGPNWTVNGQAGHPAPSAEFTWDPIQGNYFISLESYPFLADSMFEGKIYLDFDIKLSSVVPTGTELMLIQVWNWDADVWTTVMTYSNEEGSFDWESEHLDITELAMGEVFKIRFSAQGDSSINILWWLIDNIHVYRICNPPLNLSIDGTPSLSGCMLNWDYPEGIIVPVAQWIHWDDGTNANSISIPDYLDIDVASRFEPYQMIDFEGTAITQIAFYIPEEAVATYKVRVWTGPDAANLVVDQEVDLPITGSWNTVTLEIPVPIDITQELWFGYHLYGATGTLEGADDGPAIDGYGNMIYLGSWESLLEISPELDYNWNIEAYVQSNYDKNRDSRDFMKFAIYRSDDWSPYYLRDYTNLDYYLDDSAICFHPGEAHFYKLTAVYSGENETCESVFTNEVGGVCEGLNDDNQESYVSIYPNPASDYIRIESSKELGFVSIFNSFGELMLKKKLHERQVEIAVKDYPAGVYMMRVETDKERISRKVVVIH